jgi:hypothetical protein
VATALATPTSSESGFLNGRDQNEPRELIPPPLLLPKRFGPRHRSPALPLPRCQRGLAVLWSGSRCHEHCDWREVRSCLVRKVPSFDNLRTHLPPYFSVTLVVGDASWTDDYSIMPKGPYLTLGGSEHVGELAISFSFANKTLVTPTVNSTVSSASSSIVAVTSAVVKLAQGTLTSPPTTAVPTAVPTTITSILDSASAASVSSVAAASGEALAKSVADKAAADAAWASSSISSVAGESGPVESRSEMEEPS